MQTKITISIDGKALTTFKELSLDQYINKHHTFEIAVDYEAIEDFGTHTLDKSREWLGKPIVINFSDEREFVGIITNVQLNHHNGFHGTLLISGASTTTLLEAGSHTQSWLEKDLATIVNEVADAAGVDAAVAPAFTSAIEYQCQYRESHFQFLQRLAKHYNEWLYYDGVQLIFGKPSLEEAVPLAYGKEIRSLSIGIQAKASHRNIFSYNPLDDAQNESKTGGAVAGLSELGAFAFDVSKDLFSIERNSFSEARVKDRSEIDTMLTNSQSGVVANTNELRATSTKQGLSVGSVIKVSSERKTNGKLEVKNYGEYIITQINHTATGSNEYLNEFCAIAAGVAVLPPPDIANPVAEPQIATVLSNEDPEQKGRVQVQFQWQTGEMKTSWLRVMTPDAGKSDNVATNRGFMHIPEVEDQVVVGFRYNDPNRPFVMGSLFSGTTGAGGLDGNKIKSLTTRTGSTITFDDSHEQGKITISDPSGNTVTLNGDETITISAPQSVTINAKEIALNAEDKITLKGDNTVEINSKKIAGTAENEMELQSGANMKVSSKSKEETHTTYNLEAESTVDINGSATTNIKGGEVNLN